MAAAAPAPTFSPRAPPPPALNSPPSPPVASPPPRSTPSPPAVAPTTTPPPPAAPATSPPPRAVASPPPQSSPPPPTPTNNPTSPAAASPPSPPPQSSPPPPTPTNNPTSPAAASPPPPPPTTVSPSAPAPATAASPPPPSPSTPSGSPPPPAAVAGTPPSPSPPKSSSSPPPPPRRLNPSPPPKNNSSSSSGSSSPPSSSGGSSNVALVAGAAAGAVIVLGVIGLLFWCLCRKPRKRQPPPSSYESRYNPGHPFSTPVHYKTDAFVSGYSMQSDQILNRVSPSPTLSDHGSAQFWGPNRTSSMGSHGLGNSRSSFTIEDLAAATNKFSAENVLGEGGFGCVYKGTLPDGRLVAVKQLKIGSGQGEREFTAEVETISRIHHRHLVSLVGYCISENQRLLVYDFVSNGTLEHHLHGVPVLNWESRMKIAIGAARGLAYLHDDCHPRIIHRDIKSANILLDDKFEAQVSDFGLAKMSQDTNTHVSTRVMGTFGYLAPEYAASGKLTDRSDVFSFGVVLLELLTGRKPVDVTQPLGDESLVEWARPMLNECLDKGIIIEDLVDPNLEGKFDETEMFRLIEATAACVRHSSNRRPKMGQVLRALENTTPISELNNGSKPGQSMIINSALQSEEIRRFRRIAFGDSSAFSTGEFTDTGSESGNGYGNSREFGNGNSREFNGQSRDIRSREFDSGQSRDIRSREFDSRQSRQFGSRPSAFPSSLCGPHSPTSSGESETRPFNRARHKRGESTDRSSGEVSMSLKGASIYGR